MIFPKATLKGAIVCPEDETVAIPKGCNVEIFVYCIDNFTQNTANEPVGWKKFDAPAQFPIEYELEYEVHQGDDMKTYINVRIDDDNDNDKCYFMNDFESMYF